MEQPKNKLLQICGILMIIGGALGAIISIIAIIGSLALLALAGSDVMLIFVASILAFVGTLVTLLAGIAGVKNAANPAKAGVCITYGIITIALSLFSSVLSVIGGGSLFSTTTFTGLILPALYLVGAYQNKSKAV